ncbi:MAG: dephospho-CoA kinase [Clostridiales bacterium]|nr:dephospho-CoA kinase [Clostridiales bacterium]
MSGVKKRTYVLGLTGPSGAGKSLLAAYLTGKGIPVVDADRHARKATAPGSPALPALAAAFSPAILCPDGSLDRGELARRAFSSREETDRLNAILHPVILELMEKELTARRAEGHPLVVLDAPQLYEAGADAACDGVVAVLAPAGLRLARIMARDGISEEAARRRMSAGLPDSFFRDRGAYILMNDGDEAALQKAADALLDRILGE